MYGLLSMYDLKFKFNLEDMEYFGANRQVTIECEGLERFGKLMFGGGRRYTVKLYLK